MKERKYKLTVTLSEKDYAQLQKYKQATGLTTQTYFLKLFHGIHPIELPHPDFFEVLESLHHISINMNQIALKANMTGDIYADAYWENSRRMQEVISDIKSSIYEAKTTMNSESKVQDE